MFKLIYGLDAGNIDSVEVSIKFKVTSFSVMSSTVESVADAVGDTSEDDDVDADVEIVESLLATCCFSSITMQLGAASSFFTFRLNFRLFFLDFLAMTQSCS